MIIPTSRTRKRRGGRMALVVFVVVLLAAIALPYALPWTNQGGVSPDRPFAESRFVDVDGVRLHARRWVATPPRRGCDIVLVHGSLGSTADWQAIAPRLARSGRAVVALDLPGAGFSTREPVAPEHEATLLWRALDALGIGKRAYCLVGHARGARTIAAMLEAEPDRVVAMVYLDGIPQRATNRVVPGWQRALLATPPGRRAFAWWVDRRLLARDTIAAMLREDLMREPTAAELDAHVAPLRMPGTAARIVDAMRNDDAIADVSTDVLASKPTLVLWGREDQRTSARIGGMFARSMPGAAAQALDRAAHRPMQSAPDAVLAALLRWLDSQVATGDGKVPSPPEKS
jgi:pimeloyl-ACP methyl ester carboxylesterase